jgi:hypothetical protein
MLKNASSPDSLQHLLLGLLSTSGTLAGLSMALVGIVNLRVASSKVETLADDIFLFSSLGFLVVCYLVFFALRHLQSRSIRLWTNLIDAVFLLSLTLLVLAGFVVVYTYV